MTPDLHDATVYYTVYGDAADVESSAAALASATGVLRSAVGRQTGVKFTPTLQFRPDTVPEQSRQIEELLVSVRESDAELAQRSTMGRPYAGDARIPTVSWREATDDDEADGFDGDAVVGSDGDVVEVDQGLDGDRAGSEDATGADGDVPGERDRS